MRKINFDYKSLNFKLWLYFAFFALLLMAILWFLQIFFLNAYYQDMKIRETAKVAEAIEKEFGSGDFIDKIRELSITNDMYIHIETFDGSIIFSPSNEEGRRPSYAYVSEMRMVRTELLNSSEPRVSVILPEARTDANTLAYAAYLQNTPSSRVIMYIFSPLYPVASTVSILRTQLIYITIISLLLAFAVSFYISRRVTRPIREITDSAKNLAEGDYGVNFTGGHYTEISDLANTLTYASSQLEKMDALQKNLMANVSHDLRTPLTMVKSYAEMVRDISGDDPVKRDAHLNVIIEEADRLNSLVNDILALSRIQTGAMPVEKGNFNLKEAIDNILKSYSLLCESGGYVIDLQCDDVVNVNADRAKIEQVISNFLNNALKYCGPDRLVMISVKEKNGKARCEITDHGSGIPQSEIDHIWERYYMASANRERGTSGAGLGLAIVKEILAAHGAEFGVNSEPGQGSTFWFELTAQTES